MIRPVISGSWYHIICYLFAPALVQFTQQPILQCHFTRGDVRDAPALCTVEKSALQHVTAKPSERSVQDWIQFTSSFPGLVFILRPQLRITVATRPMICCIAERVMMEVAAQSRHRPGDFQSLMNATTREFHPLAPKQTRESVGIPISVTYPAPLVQHAARHGKTADVVRDSILLCENVIQWSPSKRNLCSLNCHEFPVGENFLVLFVNR